MALDRDDHEYVLDWACHYYLPNDPVFIKVSLNQFIMLFISIFSSENCGSAKFYFYQIFYKLPTKKIQVKLNKYRFSLNFFFIPLHKNSTKFLQISALSCNI